MHDLAIASSTKPRSGSSVRANLALLLFSVGLSLAVLELLARVMLPAPLPWLYPQLGYRPDPNTIFAFIPNQKGFTADKPVSINERGFRGAVLPYERTPGVLRVMFLGDSIAFGYGVNDAEVVSERVRELLHKDGVALETINTAVPAYNMLQEINYLDADGVRYQPDWVIVGVCWNDIGDKSDVRVDSQGRLTTVTAAPEPATAVATESEIGYALRNVLKRSRFMYGALEGWRALTDLREPDPQTTFRMEVLEGRDTQRIVDGWNDVANQLHRLRALADTHGFKPLLVAFPIPLAIEQPFPKSSYPARLQELAGHEGIPVIDLDPAFQSAFHGHESLFIPYDGDHPNAAGHAIAAHEIHAFLAAHVKGG